MTRWTRLRWKIGDVGDYQVTVMGPWYMPITLIWWFKACGCVGGSGAAPTMSYRLRAS